MQDGVEISFTSFGKHRVSRTFKRFEEIDK